VPQDFSILGPTGTVVTPTFEVSWAPSPGAVSYDVVIATSANLQTPVQQFHGLSVTHVTAGPLADGTPGDSYTTTFVVAPPPADEVVVGIADFARGYGQPVDVPRNTDAGIPLTLSTGQNVSRVVCELVYDPALLTITGFTTTLPGATATYELPWAGLARFAVESTAELSATAGEIIAGRIAASVPNTAPYPSKHVLDLQNV
jgi:hypothetical protein